MLWSPPDAGPPILEPSPVKPQASPAALPMLLNQLHTKALKGDQPGTSGCCGFAWSAPKLPTKQETTQGRSATWNFPWVTPEYCFGKEGGAYTQVLQKATLAILPP